MLRYTNILVVWFLMANPAFAENYSFSAPGIIIKEWSPETLEFSKGLENIRSLDKWYSRLSDTEKRNNALGFAEQRNRLFLVTQEKRLINDLKNLSDKPLFPSLPWGPAATEAIKKEKAEQLDYLRSTRTKLFEKPNQLSSEVISDLNQYQSQDKSPPELKAQHLLRRLCGNDQACQDKMRPKIYKQLGGSNPEERAKNAISQFSGKQCEPDSIPPVPAVEYFDRKLFPKEASFLRELGITSWKPKSGETDLSKLYGPPKTQWRGQIPTAECVGFAIASDASSVSKAAPISPEHTYAVMYNQDKKVPTKINPAGEEYCDPQSHSADETKGITHMAEAIHSLKKAPICSTNNELYVVDKFSALDFDHPKNHNIEPTYLKILIDNGYPPVLGMSSDARFEQEGWVFIQDSGKFRHAVNVVGYGKDIDPSTLCEVEYFLIRDSLGKKEMHYKVPAKNLLAHIDSVYKIASTKKVDRNLKPIGTQISPPGPPANATN